MSWMRSSGQRIDIGFLGPGIYCAPTDVHFFRYYNCLRFDGPFSVGSGPICHPALDRNGARRPDVSVLAGSYVGPRQVGNSVSLFNFSLQGCKRLKYSSIQYSSFTPGICR